MRAKRSILVLVESEQLRSELRVVLQVHGFRVLVCECLVEALEIAAKLEHVVAISDFPIDVLLLKNGGHVDATVMLTADLAEMATSCADRTVMFGAAFYARLVETIKIAAARKRGPKTHPAVFGFREQQKAVAAA